jgi:hypothetical protein
VIGRPAVSGLATAGRVVSGDAGVWENPSSLTFSRQWRRCNAAVTACDAIPGATSATYTATAGDVGRRLEVLVTATDSAGRTTVSHSAAGALVGMALLPPTISGATAPGAVLTCSTSGWPNTTTLSWLRDGTAIGAGATHVIVPSDAGHALTCRADDHDPTNGTTATSAPRVIPIIVPTSSSPPTIRRNKTKLTCQPGTWQNATTRKYQWLRDGEPISRATRSTYTLTRADKGRLVACLVTASNAYGSTSKRSSALRIR